MRTGDSARMTATPIDIAAPDAETRSVAVRVLFFGRLADRFGRSRSLTIPRGGCAVSALKRQIAVLVDDGEAALAQPDVRVAIDQLMACGDPWVLPGQEVAFLPAFSGG